MLKYFNSSLKIVLVFSLFFILQQNNVAYLINKFNDTTEWEAQDISSNIMDLMISSSDKIRSSQNTSQNFVNQSIFLKDQIENPHLYIPCVDKILNATEFTKLIDFYLESQPILLKNSKKITGINNISLDTLLFLRFMLKHTLYSPNHLEFLKRLGLDINQYSVNTYNYFKISGELYSENITQAQYKNFFFYTLPSNTTNKNIFYWRFLALYDDCTFNYYLNFNIYNCFVINKESSIIVETIPFQLIWVFSFSPI